VNPPSGTTFSLSTTANLTRSTGYNSWTGLTRISFTGTQTDINNALASMTVSTGSAAGNINISVSATVNPSGYNFNPVNGHFYRPISSRGITYTNAKTAARASTFKGQAGYLATITSAIEQDFINNNTTATDIWFALSDANSEGTWYIDDGPEEGRIIWRTSVSGVTNSTTSSYLSTGSAQGGYYTNWDDDEPNNAYSTLGEDHAVTKWNGGTKWNDLYSGNSTNVQGYVIEYGTWTNPDDQAFTDFYSASTTYTANCTANQTPVAPTVVSQGTRAGAGTLQLSVTVPAGTTADWYSSETGGVVLAGGSGVTTFTTPIITATTNYYVETRNTSSGCLSTSRTLVTATVVPCPTTPPNVQFKLSPPNVTTSAIQGQAGSRTESFNSLTTGALSSSGSFAVGSFTKTGTANIISDAFYGARQDNGTGFTKYLGISNGAVVSVSLTDPSRYVGFWWGGGDSGNRVTIYGSCGGNEIQLAQFTTSTVTSLLSASTVTAVDGNSYSSSAYNGTNYNGVSNEPFAYINLQLDNPDVYFTRLEFTQTTGGGFEVDNITTSTGYGAATATTPSAPTITSITPSSGSASVAFTAPSSDGGSAITNYEYSTNGGTSWTAFSPAITSSPALIPNLANGTQYSVIIRAVNSIGAGAQSNSLNVTPVGAPPVITSFSPKIAGNGETVVITGTGFTGANAVKFGNVNASSFTVNSDTQITAVVGAARSGDVYVQNSLGNDTEPGFIFKVVQYNFEGNALDQTEANLDGTVSGGVTFAPGVEGQAVCFDRSTNNWIVLPQDLIRNLSDFTISMRFKTNSKGVLLGYQNNVVNSTLANQYIPIIVVQSDGKLRATLWTSANTDMSIVSSSAVNDGNWHKIDMAITPTSINIYIDGVLAGSTNSGTVAHLQMSFNQLGRGRTDAARESTGGDLTGWQGFTGCIDNFMILDKGQTLTTINQVTQVPQATITSFTPTTAKNGETITINGTNLSGVTSVKMGGVEARSFTIVSGTQIRAIVPLNATTNTTVEITTAAGTVSANTFTYSCESNALDFDGQNDHVVVGNVIENLGAFTQEAWVYWKGSQEPFSEIFTKDLVSAMAITNTNKLHANFGNGSAWGAGVNSSTSIPINTWTHVAVTRSSSGLVKLYINGVLDASTATLALSGPNSAVRVIGGKLVGSTLNGPFNGAIDELRVWNTERSSQQISANLATNFVGNETGLLAYYNFNQGAAAGNNSSIATLNNLTSTTGLNATLTNFASSGSTSNFVTGVGPVILVQPAATTSVCVNANTGNTLSVSAVGQQLTYQWYSNTTNSTSGGTAISGANSANYTVPTTATGTQYFYVIVTSGCNSATVTSAVSTVTVSTGPSIAYASSSYSFAKGQAITAISATATNVSSFSVSPALPTGLSLNTTTGEITGTPTVSASTSTYTVTATGAGGCSASTTFSLEVTDASCNTFASTDFQTNGNTTFANNIYTLTPNQTYKNGSVWNKNRLYLDRDFDINASVYLGNSNAGADGIAFVLQNQSISAGSDGGGLGYFGISPSFAVEFDTFFNSGSDPNNGLDHIAIIKNGAADSQSAHSEFSSPISIEMEDGNWHTVRFVWNASSKNFQVWYDGVRQHNITVDLKANIFGGRSYVYWGFTGATGGATNLQQVQLPQYCYVQQVGITRLAGANNSSASTNFCVGASVNLQASTASSYQWFKDGVAIPNATNQQLEVSQSGSYTVEAVSAQQITTLSEPVVVTVSALPAISYASATYSFIRNNTITNLSPVLGSGSPTPSSYSVSPALPTGLSLNTTTGVISGRPTALTTPTDYTVTATTAAGCSTTFTLNLEVKNDAPPLNLVYNPNTQTVRQGTAITNMVPTVGGGAVITYTIAPSLPSGITINATTGVVSGNLTSAQTGSQVYTVTATNTGGTATATITLIYNSAPTDIALSPSSIAENNATNATVGTLSSTDPDTGDTHTYTLVSGTGSTDNAAFNISGNSLRASAALDFETKSSYSIRIRTTDAGGLSFDKEFTVTITNVNEAPTNIALSASSIAENNATNATVGTLSSTDVDASDTHTYTLVSGTGSTDNAAFNISGNSLKVNNALDFEAKSSYSIRIRTTDADGLTFEKVFTISVTNQNEAPTNITSSQTAIYEGNASSATVGNLTSTDPDAGDTHTYTLVSGAGSTDNASFSIAGNQLKAAVVFEFKTKNSYSIRIRTTDAGGLSFEKTFTITVLESPFATGTGNLPGSQQITAASNDVTISKGYSSNLDVSGKDLVSYSWSPAIGLSATNIANPIASPSETTRYAVTVTNNLGLSTVVYVTVNVIEDYNITPTNVITPNGDGVNDTWVIGNLNTYPDNTVQLFDKAGRMLYQVKGYQNDWDGMLNGNLLHEGAYYYVIRIGNKGFIKKGFINIIRD